MRRSLSIVFAAFLNACRVFVDETPSIAGQYTLERIDGQMLPCCDQADSSTNARATTLSGTLMLGPGAPEAFVTTPAGYYPRSCVHEVPNGATVNPTSFPRCGDGDFSLNLTQRVDSADGASAVQTIAMSGRYAWDDRQEMIKLVDVPMVGSVTLGASRTLRVQKVNVMGAYGPTYTFSDAPR